MKIFPFEPYANQNGDNSGGKMCFAWEEATNQTPYASDSL